MKRRITSLLLSFMIISAGLYGCGNNNTDAVLDTVNTETTDKEETSSDITGTVTDTAGEDDIMTQTVQVTYDYEQELNVISDNNRNYYEIFVYSFYDSDGDGIGDINGITEKLDYISNELGFNGIWLMPIMPSTTYHKYDVTDYYGIDGQYGTLEDFKKLSEECDKRDIKLIIDFVFNHTSTQHPWFKQAVAYLETLNEGEDPDLTVCPYVGYYNFTKDSAGSDTYYKAGTSAWYYEAMFWDQMPDLALANEELRIEIEKIAKYWMDMGVDGFRLDAAKEFYSGNPSKNVEVLQWFSDYVTSIKEDAYIVAEVWDTESALTTYYTSGVTSLFNFPMAQYNGLIVSTVRKMGTSSASSFSKALVRFQEEYNSISPGYIDAPFISNHDTTRVSAQCANDENQIKMAAGLLLTMNGSPFVYYGEEIGMNSSGDKDENKRLPMQWSATDLTGITTKPSAADVVEQKFAPVEEQQKDPLSILNYYKRAIRIRNENPEIARGTIIVVETLTSKDICAISKVYDDSEIVIIYNISKEAATIDLSLAGYEDLNIRGYLTVDGSIVTCEDGILEMPLYSIVVLKK